MNRKLKTCENNPLKRFFKKIKEKLSEFLFWLGFYNKLYKDKGEKWLK